MMMKVMVRKAQECAEQLLGRDSLQASGTCKQLLHANVLTPHNIPDFFLPPRLVRQSAALPGTPTPQDADTHTRGALKAQCVSVQVGGERQGLAPGQETKKWTERHQQSQTQRPIQTLTQTQTQSQMLTQTQSQILTQSQMLKRPGHLAVSRLDEGYLFESPHTRRKESLFHCAVSRLRLETQLPAVQGPPPRSHPRGHDVHGRIPPSRSSAAPLSHATLRESDGETDTPSPSSAESTPQATPTTTARRWTPSPSHLAPPLPFPLELLHCQERLHREHLLLLPTRGRLRLATERPAPPSPSLHQPPTLRVRVVSLEGLRDPDDPRPLSCSLSLSLSLSPGKLQQQHSATIRQWREPVVFNEDFFFSQPEGEGQTLGHMTLQVKVKDKSGGLGRVCVLGVICKPLAELMSL